MSGSSKERAQRAAACTVRPTPPRDWHTQRHALQIMDVREGWSGRTGAHVVYVYGTTLQGFSMCVEVHGFKPYFYAEVPSGLGSSEGVEAVERVLEEHLVECATATNEMGEGRNKKLHARYSKPLAELDEDGGRVMRLVKCTRVKRASLQGCSLRADGETVGPDGRP